MKLGFKKIYINGQFWYYYKLLRKFGCNQKIMGYE